MTRIQQSLSVLTAWAMVPMAAWSGFPSTACLCANGRVKIYCQHLSAKKLAGHEAASGRSCCCDQVEDQQDARTPDCCRATHDQADRAGVTSKECCKPILSEPSAKPEITVFPAAVELVTTLPEASNSEQKSFAVGVVTEHSTGPPFDRVISYRSLLI